MKYRYLLIPSLIICVFGCVPEYQKSQEDFEISILDSLIDSSVEMMFARNYDESLNLMDTINALSLSERDSARWALNQNNYGIWYFFKGDFQSSVNHYTAFLKWSESENDSAAISETHKNIGISWKALGYFELATEEYLSALRWNPNQRQTFTASLHNSLGNLFLTVEEFSSALFHFKEAGALWEVMGNEYLYPMALHNIGETHRMMMGFDSAIYFFSEALRLKKQYGDSSSIHHTMNSIGRTYLDQSNTLEAFPIVLESMKYYQSKGANNEFVRSVFLLIEYYLLEKEFVLANQYLNFSDSLVLTLDSRDLRVDWLSLAKDYNMQLKNWLDVVLLDSYLDSLRDILFRQEKLFLVQGEDAYRLEQEEQRTQRAENQRQLAELTSQRRQRVSWMVGGIATILLVGLLVIYRQRRQIEGLNADLNRLNFDIRHRKKNDYLRILAYFSVTREQMPELSTVMQPVENMLMASAQVDDLLYRQKGDATMGIKPYLENLLEELKEALSLNHSVPVAWQVQIEAIQLPTDHAAKLAFIIAEWVTNIYKHSFEQVILEQAAQVRVSIAQTEDQVRVELVDNGRGVTAHTLETSPGLGWKLINGFVKNLQGQLSLGTEAGARFILTFPIV
ncbi:MAG TPA: hypothetical protein DCR93_22695 [Cytophagales bacterium]|nr:hypothetical protein [Cytophagales bacterium]HAP62184.1 hypothetical protein [Cytophagales bacterium]